MSSEVGVEHVLVGEKAVTVRTGVDVLAGVHVQVASNVVSGSVGFPTNQTDVP